MTGGRQERADRSAEYPRKFDDIEVYSFPHFFIPQEYQDLEKGALYFKESVYKEIAKCVRRTINSRGSDLVLVDIFAKTDLSFNDFLAQVHQI